MTKVYTLKLWMEESMTDKTQSQLQLFYQKETRRWVAGGVKQIKGINRTLILMNTE